MVTDSGSPIEGLIFGLLFAVIGAVLVTNFKGLASAHARASIRSAQPLRRVAPWRWLPLRTPEQDMQFASRMQRVVGAMFLVAGLGFSITSILDLL